MIKFQSIFKENKKKFLFIFLLLLVSFLYGYPEILSFRPYSIHQWRQSDCLSIAVNYYKDDLNFFEPAVHWVGTADGKTVSECPIIYYTVAQLWKIFGYHEFIFRIVNVFIVFLGLYCFYKLVYGLLSDYFWAFSIPIFLFTSPILVFYSNNFTADAPAFGLALVGCYLLWSSIKKGQKVRYYASFLFFLLAGLIKISSLISFIAILLIHVYSIFFSEKKRLWFYKWYNVLPYFFVFAAIIAWYKYAIFYNQNNVSGVFLTGIYPIWDLDQSAIKNIWLSLKNDLLPAYFNNKALSILLILFVTLFFFYKKVNKYLFYLTLLVFLGVLVYLILFYQAFTVHDYYLTNLLIFIPLPLITLLEMLSRNYNRYFHKIQLKIFFAATVLLLTYETAVINRAKYFINDKLVRTNFVVSDGFVNQWVNFHREYASKLKVYENLTPHLRKLGIKRSDRVLSLQDHSINISLCFMDQKGFTAFGYGDLTLDKRMQLYKQNGVQYLVSDTSYYFDQKTIHSYVQSKIGHFQNIGIYLLK
jgi:4-amino-4-deoxy-L-arabinose transferase-like glycosyltransferase